ncbi:universal stress protein [Eggerthellaceae bacterium zg-1084]|uniref:Universal stress protein n=1 Tax=Berryella wangjianweii TaxID=2734634 RepID=A0A6M8J8Z5_9ACTN|nr:universal stress protein [Berryella wangjianweii]NPD31529.1 universal stress protein [Berryella wangjianweii]NPD32976.1 universal stress protein [Eggerthellaceae bacterium zg-997]QKF07849.1 universal stress protein [Berryella wangjianweii]
MGMYQRIFVALDGGPTQEAVARRAAYIAQHNNAALLFGHVIDSVPYEANGIDFAALCTEGRENIERELASVLAEVRADDQIPSVDLSVHAGRITDTLLESQIEPFNPDLVVCGARGLSNIKYALVGSVSTFLIRNIDCDVLVVKPEEGDE